MSEDIKVLKEISYKLDQVITLLKLSNMDALKKVSAELSRDRVSKKILELADGTLSYSDLTKKVSEELGVAEITVKKKIARLKELGLLLPRRRRREVYYENTGLL